MGKKRKAQLPTRGEIATQIEEVAERLANGDRSFDLYIATSAAQAAQVGLGDIERHLDGLKLLSRVGFLLVTENGTADMKYDFVR